MLKHPELTRQRVEHFLTETLRPRLWAETVPMEAAVYHPEGGPRDYRQMRIEPARAAQYPYTPVASGYTWGPCWSDAWFRLTGSVPAEWAGKNVVARIDTGAESIVWEGDNPLQGIDEHHREITLFERARGGESVTLHVQATGMNPNVSVHGRPKEPSPTPYTFQGAQLAVYDERLWAFYYDVKMAYEVMQQQPADGPRYGELLYALNEVVNRYDERCPDSTDEASERLRAVYDRPASASAHRISAIGHAHIDSAWLWPLERTQYKCLHTFATALRLMDAYPEYRFVCSQAAQYEWVKNMAPRLYERIKERIKSGQWEVTGSMWVEADCNLSSGESLIRQILHGKNYFQDEFGIETKDLWLPDVFGYAAALPQILKKARIDVFLTQKMSRNQINKFPHHTFLWQGIDGTRIFTHFPPADTYNAMMTPKELLFNVSNFREHGRATRSLYVFGYGDGGGGPTQEMLENARRLRNIEGMPMVTLEKASEFFRKAREDARGLPVWVGELYLELHRGTYTTQARNKRGNRKAELALRDAEFLSVVRPEGLAAYPLAALDRAWKTTLLNQFHDIIPGSSVHEVYQDSAQDYAQIQETAQGIITEAVDALAGQIGIAGRRRPVLVISNLSQRSSEVVELPLGPDECPTTAVSPDGIAVPVQVIQKPGGARAALFMALHMPAHGYEVWDLGAAADLPADLDRVEASPTYLENGWLRVEFDPRTGLVTRIYDREHQREVLSVLGVGSSVFGPIKTDWSDPTNPSDPKTEHRTPNTEHPTPNTGCGNQLWLYEDKPLFWDAWDVDVYYQEKGQLLRELDSAEVVESGPVRGAIRFTRTLPGGPSTIVQTVRLAAASKRLEFVTEVDWHETDRMLKVAFPVAINSPRATYEIQYGHVERPTHFNTSWDLARFEVCAQKWADLSEGDYGVALLNDCKYGHDIHGNVMRLTLLRSPKAPDPEADMGRHEFTYALLPHGDGPCAAEVIENAYALNSPPLVRALPSDRPGPLPRQRSFFAVDNLAVVIEAIKRAEKEDAVIVRLYEAHNTRGSVTSSSSLPVRQAFRCDLLEANEAELELSGGEVTLPIQPFEIVTVKLIL